MQTYISGLSVYIWPLVMWKLIVIYFWTGSKLESGKLPNNIKWRVNSSSFFGCVCRVLDFLVTKINNKKTSKIFQFRPTKEEKFKLMTPWFMRFFFFFWWFISYVQSFKCHFFSIIKYFHLLLVRECAWIELGRWRAIFLTNPPMTSWKNFNLLPTH